jgi:hypothetical protein
MTRVFTPICLIVLSSGALAVGLSSQQPVAKPPVLVEGARVLDVARGRYLEPAAVFIEAGRIRSVTPEAPASLPAGTVRVKAAGSTLVPGLIDLHAWAAPVADLEADYFYLMGLAHGVTGYRVMNARTGWGVAQRERSISGEIVAPRVWTSGRGINQGPSPDRWLFDATDPSVAIGEVRRQIDARVNWVAGYDALTPDIYKAIVAAAKGTDVRVSGHRSARRGPVRALGVVRRLPQPRDRRLPAREQAGELRRDRRGRARRLERHVRVDDQPDADDREDAHGRYE